MRDEFSIEGLKAELAKATPGRRKRIIEKFVMAALGSVPWVGGFLSAAYAYKAEADPLKADELRTRWLEEHVVKIEKLKSTLEGIAKRFETLGEQIDERLQSEDYLALVRRAFRVWDRADTDEKRAHVGKLVANAAGARLCSDDVVRLFIDWIDHYDEAHFAVIREIFQHPGCTRWDIWSNIRGSVPREDSADADLYRLLIRDLSTGGVIRQERETTREGEFVRRRPPRHRAPASPTMESSFEDSKPYILTELGSQFVHYTMNEIVPRLGGEPPNVSG